jgi:hypothetical protein
MAPIAISSPSETARTAVDQIKAGLQQTKLNNNLTRVSVAPAPEEVDFTQYSHFDATPAIGTEFRAYSPDGKPVLSIRDILGDDAKLKALGRLV